MESNQILFSYSRLARSNDPIQSIKQSINHRRVIRLDSIHSNLPILRIFLAFVVLQQRHEGTTIFCVRRFKNRNRGAV